VEFFSFLSLVFLLLCLGYLYPRSWLFDADLIHELALVVFLVIRYPGLLGCGGSVKGYTYILLVFAYCRFVIILEVTYRLVSW
jgi:hypothetical protein